MTTKFEGKRRHTRKGPPMRNRTEQTRQDEHVFILAPNGSIVNEYWNQRVGYELRISGVGALIQGNGIDPNPWKYTVEQQRFIGGKLDSINNGVLSQRMEGTYNSTSLTVPSWDRAGEVNRCIEKWFDQVRGGLDLAVDIAEMGQVKRMLGSSFKLVNFVRSIPELGPLLKRAAREAGNVPGSRPYGRPASEASRRGSNARQVARLGGKAAIPAAKAVADKWLEYQYGWKPLLGSIYGAADESIRFVLNKIQNWTVKTHSELGAPASQNIRDIRVLSRDRYNQVSRQSCEISIWMEIPSDRWSLDRWTSLNPASIAWELMPYSFVVDWFYDIGGMLRRFESALIYDKHFRKGYQSELYYHHSAFQRNGLQQSLLPGWQFYGELTAWVRKVDFERIVFSSLPTGQLPTIKADLGSTRLLNAAALLSQFLKPGGKTYQ